VDELPGNITEEKKIIHKTPIELTIPNCCYHYCHEIM